MKKQDPHSGSESFEEVADAASASIGVTGLFLHNDTASAAAGNHEVTQLLREPGATVSHGTGASPAVERAANVPEPGMPPQDDTPHASFAPSSPEEGFTQLFQSLSAASGSVSSNSPGAGPRKDAQAGAAAEAEPLPPLKRQQEPLEKSQHSQGSQLPGQSESTWLFHRLERDEPTAAGIDDRLSSPPATKFVGGFTQLLRTLSVQSQTEIPVLPMTPAPSLSQPAGGPGEFTRIISGSMLREARGRTGTPARAEAQPAGAGESVDPTPVGAIGGAVPMTPAPPAVVLTPQQLIAPPPLQMAVAAVPQVEPGPLAQQPQIPPQAPEEGKMQKYIRLLLISNAFLLLMVLILVMFVLLHH
jgi:hypothetical protein